MRSSAMPGRPPAPSCRARRDRGPVGAARARRRTLAAILATQHTTAGVASVWPRAAAIGGITALPGLAGAVLREQQRLLSELTSRYAQDRILDVTCAVELAAFDQPEFHDRAARTTSTGLVFSRAWPGSSRAQVYGSWSPVPMSCRAGNGRRYRGRCQWGCATAAAKSSSSLPVVWGSSIIGVWQQLDAGAVHRAIGGSRRGVPPPVV